MRYLYTMEFNSATKRNEILSFEGKWIDWRTSSKVKLARLRRPKPKCFLSYSEYSPNINVTIL
jgi:hypothetical protein